MGHVHDQLAARVNDAAERASVQASIDGTLRALRSQGVRDAAVRVWRASVKQAASDGSNGDTAVLIVRGGQSVTLMWRRATQPHTAEALRVNKVMCVKGTCTPAEHRGHR